MTQVISRSELLMVLRLQMLVVKRAIFGDYPNQTDRPAAYNKVMESGVTTSIL